MDRYVLTQQEKAETDQNLAGMECAEEGRRGYVCTRIIGHEGRHVASTGTSLDICDVWEAGS